MTMTSLSRQPSPMMLFLNLLLFSGQIYSALTGRSESRHIDIINSSGRSIEIYWLNPDTGEGVKMSDPSLVHGQEFPLDSYVGHSFEAREVPNKRTGSCDASAGSVNNRTPDACRRAIFQVSPNDDQIFNITTDFVAVFVDNKIKASMEAGDLVKACQEEAKQRIVEAISDPIKVQQAVEDLMQCVHGGVANALGKMNEEISFQASIRKTIAATLENYTCDDDTLNSTEDISEEVWDNPGGIDEWYQVHIKFDRPAAKIHVIEDFIREDECAALEKAAIPTLHRAAVADGKGGSQISENRKAMQAGIVVPWEEEENDNPIARLSRRVYDYTNHALGLNIEEFGQEELMSIQYFGRGRNDTEPDRYTPHCDGDCTGLPHKEGQRMATMVMYCTVPDAGGHTNFRNAGVHVKPELFAAVFFSYMDPVARVMDTGYTEHSGCPVYEGTKKIVTQWIRLGVDSDNPWDSFNTLGIKLSELEDFDDNEDDEEMEVEDSAIDISGIQVNDVASEPDIRDEL